MNEESARRALEESMKRWDSNTEEPHDLDQLMVEFKTYLLKDFTDRNKKYFK